MIGDGMVNVNMQYTAYLIFQSKVSTKNFKNFKQGGHAINRQTTN